MQDGFWEIQQWNTRGQEVVCCETIEEVFHYFNTMLYYHNKVRIRFVTYNTTYTSWIRM